MDLDWRQGYEIRTHNTWHFCHLQAATVDSGIFWDSQDDKAHNQRTVSVNTRKQSSHSVRICPRGNLLHRLPKLLQTFRWLRSCIRGQALLMPRDRAPPAFDEARGGSCLVFIQVAACTLVKWTCKGLQFQLDAACQVVLCWFWNQELGHTTRMVKSLALPCPTHKDLNQDTITKLALFGKETLREAIVLLAENQSKRYMHENTTCVS